jgi:hypothetical protein
MQRFIYEQAIKDNYESMYDPVVKQDVGKTYINICRLIDLANTEGHNMSYLDMQEQELKAIQKVTLKYQKYECKDFCTGKKIIYRGN